MLNFPRWKVFLIALVCLYGAATALPNFLSEEQRATLPAFMPEDTLNLGLDLQGGVHLLWGAQTEDVVKARLDNLADQIRDISREEARRRDVPREQRITFTDIDVSENAVTARVRNSELTEEARQKLLPLTQSQVGGGVAPVLGGGVQEVELERTDDVFTLTLTEQGIEIQKRDAISRSMEVMRKRVDPTGTKEITLQPQGSDRIVLEVPGASDPEEIKTLIGKTAKLSFHDVETGLSADDIAKGRLRPRQKVLYTRQGQPIVINERVIVSGDDLTDAKPAYDRGQPVVSFAFNLSGAKRFGTHTANNVGRPFAIVLDDEVISAPTINGPIPGGQGIIQGVGNIKEVNELSTLLKAGALPVKLTVLAERTVGPDLGKDNIDKGSLAAIIGFVGVIVYMIISYGLFGVAANVALITNLILITGFLSLFQATLTLPGIAGIVLTIGMAVDANVLIFERIREEQRAGAKPFQAMERGYGQAFSTIMDANITTFIAAAILYFLGSGPVQGFAVTLGIGILTSMFTAVVLTRYILSTWLKRKRPTVLPI